MHKVLVVEDHPIVQRGIRSILEEKSGFHIYEAASGEEALEKIDEDCPDIVLLDISLPGIDGIEVLAKLKQSRPFLRVLMLSIHAEEEYAVRALKHGADGYLTKKSAPAELARAMEMVMEGKKYISASLANLLVSSLKDDRQESAVGNLSVREYQVMQMIGAGGRMKEIAAELSISQKAASTYRARLLKKMHMSSNAELIKYLTKKELH